MERCHGLTYMQEEVQKATQTHGFKVTNSITSAKHLWVYRPNEGL